MIPQQTAHTLGLQYTTQQGDSYRSSYRDTASAGPDTRGTRAESRCWPLALALRLRSTQRLVICTICTRACRLVMLGSAGTFTLSRQREFTQRGHSCTLCTFARCTTAQRTARVDTDTSSVGATGAATTRRSHQRQPAGPIERRSFITPFKALRSKVYGPGFKLNFDSDSVARTRNHHGPGHAWPAGSIRLRLSASAGDYGQ